MSEGFFADPDGIELLARLMDRQAYAASLYRDQLNRPDVTTSKGEEGLLGVVFPTVDHWLALARDNTSTAERLAAGARDEFDRAARSYAHTDVGSAARLDQTFPPAHPAQLSLSQTPDPDKARRLQDEEDAAADPRHPDRAYAGPPELDDDNPAKTLLADEGWPAGLEKTIQEALGTGGMLAVFTGTIQEITGVDVVEKANSVLGGDWRQLYREAVLFGDAGHAFRAIRANVLNGRIGIEQYWRGNAAGGAEQWLDRYAAASGQHAEFMTEAGQRILDWAQASYHLMENLRDGLGLVLDVALAIVTEGSSEEVEAAIEVFEATVGDAGTLVGLAKGDDVPQRLVGLIASLCEAVRGVSDTTTALLALAHGLAASREIVAMLAPVGTFAWPPDPYHYPGG